MIERSLRPRLRPATLQTSSPRTGPVQPGQVARAAAETARLPRSGPVLLGTFGQAGDLRALVRHPNGRTETLSRGDRLGRGRVLTVEDGRIAILQGGRTAWLGLP